MRGILNTHMINYVMFQNISGYDQGWTLHPLNTTIVCSSPYCWVGKHWFLLLSMPCMSWTN